MKLTIFSTVTTFFIRKDVREEGDINIVVEEFVSDVNELKVFHFIAPSKIWNRDQEASITKSRPGVLFLAREKRKQYLLYNHYIK